MKYALSIFVGIIFTTLVGVFVAHAQDYTPLAPLPGTFTGATGSETTNLSTYLGGMLKLLIALGAGVSILVAIIGGTQYVVAGIAPSAKQDAKERILNALIGLTLVLTSYLILNSINPGLVQFNFSLPPIGTSPAPTTPTTPTGGVCPSPNDASAACCPTGIACQACSGCSVVSGVQNKGCDATVCFLNTSLLSKIQNISGVAGWRITESWPPTVAHISSCHQNGTCADLNNSGGPTDPTTIKTYYDAFVAAGLSVLYESSNCALYTAVGVTNCQSYPTMTNQSSFHVR